MGRKSLVFLVSAALFAACSFSAFPASANSAAPYWEGVTATGAIITGEDCPLQVKKEVLTFDLQEFPSFRYDAAYSGKLTAEYTFYNPTEYAVRAKMLFPFGYAPSYWTDTLKNVDDTGKYDVTVNGKAVQKTLRYTWTEGGYSPWERFDIYEEMQKLSDTPLDCFGFTPETPVYEYTYTVNLTGKNCIKVNWYYELEQEKLPLCLDEAIFESAANGNTRVFSAWAEGKESVSLHLYSLGKSLGEAPVLKGVTSNADVFPIEEGALSVEEKETSFSSWVLKNCGKEEGEFELDLYNRAVQCVKNHFLFGFDYYFWTRSLFDFIEDEPMRWYAYEMEVGAGATVTNAVTAPLYPQINNLDGYNRYQSFTYSYLLSPASTWASFEDLTVRILTPHTLTESSYFSSFERTENGYYWQSPTLPEGELVFTLRDPQNIALQNTRAEEAQRKKTVTAVVSAGVLGGALLIVVALCIRKKKGK